MIHLTIVIIYGLLMKSWPIVTIFLLIYPLTMIPVKGVQIL